MCKANGKRWSDYRESDRCQKYLDALAQTTGIPVFDLIDSRRGNDGGTYVHPQVAIELSCWLSATFAVWLHNWFLEAINAITPAKTQVALPEGAEKLEWLMGFCDKWNIQLDARDMLHIKETARTLALPPAGQGQSIYNDYPISRLVQDRFGVVLSNAQYSAIGRVFAKLWRNERGEDPQQHDQYVDGANRAVAHYPRDWAEEKLVALEQERPELFKKK